MQQQRGTLDKCRFVIHLERITKSQNLGEERKGGRKGKRRTDHLSSMETVFLVLLCLLGGKFTEINYFVPLSLCGYEFSQVEVFFFLF